MENNNFIDYNEVFKILEKNWFYGFTGKCKNNRVTYTFRSIRYPKVLISVKTLKIEPNKIPSKKIVLGIKFNDIEMNGWKEFIKGLKEIYKFNKKNYGYIKKNQYHYNSCKCRCVNVSANDKNI